MRFYLLIITFCFTILKGFSQDTLAHSLLWKISGNGLKQPSYLYGTIHGICLKDIKLKPKLIKVLNQAYTLVFECNFKKFDPYKDKDITINIYAPVRVPGGVIVFTGPLFKIPRDISEEDYMHNNESLESILTPEKYSFVHHFFKDSLEVKRGIKPFQFYHPLITLYYLGTNMLGCATSSYEEFIGHKMADAIYQYKGLESVREIASISHRYKTYGILANELFETTKKYTSLKAKEMEAYRHYIAEYNAENISFFKINKELNEDQIFVIERNIKWIPKIEQMIKKHITVIAVGVGHLAGEDGLIDLLKAKGYSVTPVFE